MAKKLKGPQIILANRLDDGRAVFFTREKTWSCRAVDAWLAADEQEQQAALIAAQQDEVTNKVIGIELISAAEGPDGPRPAHQKHVIQNDGPTIRLDLGYQAEGAGA